MGTLRGWNGTLGEAARAVRIVLAMGVLSALGAGCASEAVHIPATYVVQPRDTLYAIAWRHDLDYRQLARWNHIGPDYRIAVGQVLTLKPGRYGPGDERAAEPAPSLPQRWTWPTAHAAAPLPVPGGGIWLPGQVGQPIRAACGGRVVYAGSGIRGYGNLIIIKHGDTLLSAYAHTVDLAVREDQEVAAGERIARMGTGPHHKAALYFEIRLDGKPVDPLPFLPSGE